MTVDVVIAGGGPTGLLLAAELRLAGTHPLILESLPEPSQEPKANGLLGQVVPLLDRRGLYERLSGEPGPPKPNTAYFMFASLPMDLSLLDDSPIYALPAPQPRIVRVLEEHATELGAQIRRGHKVTGFTQDDDGVTVEVAGPEGSYQVRARFLVGADGAHSRVRKLSGIGFPGITYDRTTTHTAHATVPAEWIDPASGGLNVPGYGTIRPFLPHRTEHGAFSYAPLPGQPPLVSTVEWDQPAQGEPMSLDELRASVRRVLGADLPLGPPDGDGPPVLRRLSGGNTRIADRFADRRVFLVGDAAHVYTSGGGPGLNLGLQDAVNLGWKLAAVVRGAPPALLDSYHAERGAAAQRMATYARAQAALNAPGGDVTALRELFGELLGHESTVRHLAHLTAGSDVRYEVGDAHPLMGCFAPDLALRTSEGKTRLAELARSGKPLLLDLTEDGSVAAGFSGWRGEIDVVAGHTEDTEATALLIRPDGYVAWASDSPASDRDALSQAALRWFGAADQAGLRTSQV